MKGSESYKSYLSSPYKSVKHSTYFDVYDELFSRYRGQDITFVEIGVLGGGSLYMWRNFFGPKARIIGVDMNPNAKKWESEGFEIFIGSQSDEAFWRGFIRDIGKVDIVLDDGGHTYEQQIITTEMLLENIKSGGVLVVEDTHTSYMDYFGPRKYSFINYAKLMTDKINFRFSKFKKRKSESRVWSIRFFESIVAFEVNREAVSVDSQRTSNEGQDDDANDYRHEDNRALRSFNAMTRLLRYLRYIPGLAWLKKSIAGWIKNSSFSCKKYFD